MSKDRGERIQLLSGSRIECWDGESEGFSRMRNLEKREY